jgi:large subunit ribosomal protein L22
MNANLVNTEIKAVAKYIRMSPNKVRRVLNQIRGKSYKEALMILEFMPYSACKPVLQVLQSAAANAENNNGKSNLCRPGSSIKTFQTESTGKRIQNKEANLSYYNLCKQRNIVFYI